MTDLVLNPNHQCYKFYSANHYRIAYFHRDLHKVKFGIKRHGSINSVESLFESFSPNLKSKGTLLSYLMTITTFNEIIMHVNQDNHQI